MAKVSSGVPDIGVGALLSVGPIKDKELLAIKDSWDKSTGGGRDEEGARELARAYVDKHPERFGDLANLDLPQLVKAVETFREAGTATAQWLVETWLLARVPKQYIGGTINYVAGPDDIQGE